MDCDSDKNKKKPSAWDGAIGHNILTSQWVFGFFHISEVGKETRLRLISEVGYRK